MENVSDGKLIDNVPPSYFVVDIELVVNSVDFKEVEDVHDAT